MDIHFGCYDVSYLMYVNETMRRPETNTYIITYLWISWDALILCHHVFFLDDTLDEKRDITLNNNNGEQCLTTFALCE